MATMRSKKPFAVLFQNFVHVHVHDHVHEIVARLYLPTVYFFQILTGPVFLLSATDTGEEPQIMLRYLFLSLHTGSGASTAPSSASRSR